MFVCVCVFYIETDKSQKKLCFLNQVTERERETRIYPICLPSKKVQQLLIKIFGELDISKTVYSAKVFFFLKQMFKCVRYHTVLRFYIIAIACYFTCLHGGGKLGPLFFGQ